ncbi:HEAT repeat domain-containing protein [Methanoregula sp.]|uniref:HEAT repeat domain-containing protein n=1 Tax=Methanoregula sp. TaxID=2052170 RepID=UPI002606519E|nr:HEAT repeat domain-containing protein [Methanoregula sp.]MDD5143894.1 HEAT repeat domain-containing protein [Methanoregula sp.]
MVPQDLFSRPAPDIAVLEEQRDISALIRHLASANPADQVSAAEALARMGSPATGPLIAALTTRNRARRLGIIAALGQIGDVQALDALAGLTKDKSSEIRYQACIALGQIEGGGAVPVLLTSLRDRDKYVRHASAVSLNKAGYVPETDDDRAWFAAGMQDWERLTALRNAAVPVLTSLLSDPDADLRRKAVRALGAIGSSDAGPALLHALGDEDRQVRWEAMLASQKCEVPSMLLPRGLCRRPRLRKNPLVAGVLNFLLPGLGYGYLGKWWGIMIFQIDITATVWIFKYYGEANTYGILFPLYIILGMHAWYITKKMPEEPS